LSHDAGGETSTLKVTTINRTFNWADATLEVYNIEDCGSYASGTMTFKDMKMVGVSGAVLTPDWAVT